MKSRLQKIHDYTMRILSKTGVRFHHPEALEMLKKNAIRVDGNIAYFTEEQIMHFIEKAPKTFTVYAKNPKYDAFVGGDNSVLAPCSSAPFVVDKDGEKHSATINDYIKMMKLFEGNEHFSVNGGSLVMPSDIPAQCAPHIFLYTAYTRSEKCISGRSGNKQQLEAQMKMLMSAFGNEEELAKKPRMVSGVSMNTPLMLDPVMTETIIINAKYRQPIFIASAGMAGTTSPITLAATIALANAEILSGIALAQMFAPGTPCLYGTQTTTSDLRNGAIAIGAPEGALCYKYGAQLAKFYGLPCRGGGSLSDAKVVNTQAGYESMITFMSTYLNRMNYIVHSAGILDGFACASFEKVIADFEVIDFVKRFDREFEIDDETIPLDIIDEVGPEGSFISEMHTIEYCRVEPLTPKISVRGNTNNPKVQLEINMENRMNELIESYKKPEVDSSAVLSMRETLKELAVPDELIKKIDTL